MIPWPMLFQSSAPHLDCGGWILHMRMPLQAGINAFFDALSQHAPPVIAFAEKSDEWWGGNLAHACVFALIGCTLYTSEEHTTRLEADLLPSNMFLQVYARMLQKDCTCLRARDAYGKTPLDLLGTHFRNYTSIKRRSDLLYAMSLPKSYRRQMGSVFQQWQACVDKARRTRHAVQLQFSLAIIECSPCGEIEGRRFPSFQGGACMQKALAHWTHQCANQCVTCLPRNTALSSIERFRLLFSSLIKTGECDPCSVGAPVFWEYNTT